MLSKANTLVRFTLIVLLSLPVWSCQGQESSTIETDRISFGDLVEHLSGKGGYFDTDNLISNESSYLHVIPQLERLDVKGGAYLGVGPDQNFSYIAHIKPEIALIVDIRRDNMLMHLLYKSLFELSENRVQFLSNLFAREVESATSEGMDVKVLLSSIEDAAPMSENQIGALRSEIESTLKTYRVDLSQDDLATIHRFHAEFIRLGPNLRFTSHNRSPRNYYPTYRDLIEERDVEGNYASFLSQEPLYQFVKELQENDLIIPVVGNFADPDALPAIGKFLKDRGLGVTAFYTSNVEYYLMYQGQFPSFLGNLRQLPVHEESVIIRSYFNRFRSSHPLTIPGYASTQLLQTIDSMLANPDATYSELIFNYFLQK